MKRHFLLCFLCAALLSALDAGHAGAQTLRLLTISDTADGSIGQGAERNALKLTTYFRRVTEIIGIKFESNRLHGADFNCASIEQAIEQLRTPTQDKDKDIIVLYYSGHGFRTPAMTSLFPQFYCGSNGPYPALADVAGRLENSARLVLAMADTCNVVINEPAFRAPAAAALATAAPPRVTQLKSLFLGHKGMLTVSSSMPDQYSWYLPNGGLFTTQFLDSLDRATAPNQQGLWDNVLYNAMAVIKVETGPNRMGTVDQNPQKASTLQRVSY